MKTHIHTLIIMVFAMFIFGSNPALAEDKRPFIEAEAFKPTAKGFVVEPKLFKKQVSQLDISLKLRVSPPKGKSLRIPEQGSVKFQVWKDGKVVAEEVSNASKATTSEAGALYFFFEGGTGKFLSVSRSIILFGMKSGKYEVSAEVFYNYGGRSFSFILPQKVGVEL